MKNSILVAGFIALLAFGAWFAFDAGDELAPSPAMVPEQSADVDELDAPKRAASLTDGSAATKREEVEASVYDRTELAGDLAVPPPRSLRVRVLDATEQPVEGIEVQLLLDIGPWRRIEQRATTAEDGIATFESVGMAAANSETPDGEAVPLIHVDALVAERVEVRLDAVMLGRDEPVVLRLPPTGSVLVQVLDVEHGPPRGNISVELSHVPDGEAREVSLAGRRQRASVKVRAEDGVARFPFVSCGIDVNAVVTRDSNSASCGVFGRGPLRPGEEVRLQARFGEDHPIVQLRAIDDAGLPFAASDFAVKIEVSRRSTRHEHEVYPRSDEEGRLRIDFELDKKATRSLTIRGPQGPSVSERPIAHVVLPKALPKGLTDLGDVTLGVAPLFVAGVVVDDTGRPLPGLALVLQRQESVERVWWQGVREFDARTNDDGRFEVYGTRTGEAFRIAAHSPDHASRFIEFEPGAADLLIELVQPGGIAGKLLLDPGVDPTVLQLVLVNGPSDESMDSSSKFTRPAADGSFSLGNLLAGSGRELEVRSQSILTGLLRVKDLDVVAGLVLRDPRINPLDLRGRLFQHELVPVGGDAAGFFAGGQIYFGAVGADSLAYAGTIGLAPLTIAAPFERIDLKAKYNGFRTIALTNVGGRIELRLRESLEVTIVLLGGAKLPEPPIFVKSILISEGGGREDRELFGEPFDERREVRVKAPGAGRMEVQWVIERKGDRNGVGGSFGTFAAPEPRHVDVLEGVEGQRFEITVTQEELDEIVGRMP